MNDVYVKCKHCKADFRAPIDNAVCYKCGRSASRPLLWQWKAMGLGFPPAGLTQYLMLKMHSPLAARQALYSTLQGTGIYTVLGAAFWVVNQVF